MKPEPETQYFDGNAFFSDPEAKTASWFSKSDTIGITAGLLSEMKAVAQKLNADLRVCLHKNPEAAYHDMIILQHRKNFYRPHKHLNKGETWHILEGRLASFVFDENGGIADARCLSPNSTFLYRIGNDKYHVGIPISDIVIFHESKPGPFLASSDSIFPNWAPDGSNDKQAQDYRDSLLNKLTLE